MAVMMSLQNLFIYGIRYGYVRTDYPPSYSACYSTCYCTAGRMLCMYTLGYVLLSAPTYVYAVCCVLCAVCCVLCAVCCVPVCLRACVPACVMQ
jgi:hypothetical protein